MHSIRLLDLTIIGIDENLQGISSHPLKLMWIRIVKSKMSPLRGLPYDHSWIRWLVRREIKSSEISVIPYRHAEITDETFEEIWNPCLTTLDLSKCYQISDASIHFIAGGCPKLSAICLAGCESISDLAMVILGDDCKELTSVDVSGCIEITDTGVSDLVYRNHNYRNINLDGCYKITDIALTAISKNLNLETLDISGCSDITDHGISYCVSQCRLLSTIRAEVCSFNGTTLDTIGRYCTQLTTISFSKSLQIINDNHVLSLVKRCPLLTSIDFGNLRSVTDEALASISLHCFGLKSLNMSGSKSFGDDGVWALLEGCNAIEELDFSGCSLTCDSTKLIGKKCHALISIALSRCVELEDDGMIELAKGCPLLKTLDVEGCLELTDATFIALGSHCPTDQCQS